MSLGKYLFFFWYTYVATFQQITELFTIITDANYGVIVYIIVKRMYYMKKFVNKSIDKNFLGNDILLDPNTEIIKLHSFVLSEVYSFGNIILLEPLTI